MVHLVLHSAPVLPVNGTRLSRLYHTCSVGPMSNVPWARFRCTDNALCTKNGCIYQIHFVCMVRLRPSLHGCIKTNHTKAQPALTNAVLLSVLHNKHTYHDGEHHGPVPIVYTAALDANLREHVPEHVEQPSRDGLGDEL